MTHPQPRTGLYGMVLSDLTLSAVQAEATGGQERPVPPDDAPAAQADRDRAAPAMGLDDGRVELDLARGVFVRIGRMQLQIAEGHDIGVGAMDWDAGGSWRGHTLRVVSKGKQNFWVEGIKTGLGT